MTDPTAESIFLSQLKRLAGATISSAPALQSWLTTAQTTQTAPSASVSPVALALSSLTQSSLPVSGLSLIPGAQAGSQSALSRGLSSIFSPVLSGVLFGLKALVGNHGGNALPPLVRYMAPAPLRLQQAITGSSQAALGSFDLDARGLPRLIESGHGPASPKITINVQAIDSKSFEDHSTEIANALRSALLQSHSLNDLLQEY